MEGNGDGGDLHESLIGQPWENLFNFSQSNMAADEEKASPPQSGRRSPLSPCDVKRLPPEDFLVFGRRPMTDPFTLMGCPVCEMLLIPQFLKPHMNRKHPDHVMAIKLKTAKIKIPPIKVKLTSSHVDANVGERQEPDSSSVKCSLCSITIPAFSFRRHVQKIHEDSSAAKPISLISLKNKTVKKSSPPKKIMKPISDSPQESTEPISKELHENLIGQPWEKLFNFSPSETAVDDETNAPPSGRHAPLSPCDSMRLPAEDYPVFGELPMTDPFALVECPVCQMLLMPQFLKHHTNRRHPDYVVATKLKTAKIKIPSRKVKVNSSVTDSSAAVETQLESELGSVNCSLCFVTIPVSAFRRHVLKMHSDESATANALKLQPVKKLSPPKKVVKPLSDSPPELFEQFPKEVKKPKKSCPSPVPPELEPILPTIKRVVLTPNPPDLQPVDIQKKSKKKSERKPDKVYDPNKNCGVVNEDGKPCLRNILCKAHLVAEKRAVANRSSSYDSLAKHLKSQIEEERRVKPQEVILTPTSEMNASVVSSDVWDEKFIKLDVEPLPKRLKTEGSVEDLIGLPSELPSDLEALIDLTLQEQPLGMFPVDSLATQVPRAEPLIRWGLRPPASPPVSLPPPPVSPDLPWSSSPPKPVATNSFGCRLVGGLLTRCKRIEAFRKQVHSVWGPVTASDSQSKYSKSSSFFKKSPFPAKRKRRNSGSNPDVAAGFVGRAANNNAPLNPTTTPPNGVNGVPIRIFPNSQPTFIQLNMCPSK